MLHYIIRRFIGAILVVIAVTLVTFLIFQLIPVCSCVFALVTVPLVVAATARAYADYRSIEGRDRA